MTNLLRADLYVLVRSRALWIALAVSSAMAVAYFVSARLIANGTYDMSISGSVAGFSDAMALPLLGSLLIGVAAASDLENRTVHDRLLAAPRSVHVAVKTVMALALTAVRGRASQTRFRSLPANTTEGASHGSQLLQGQVQQIRKMLIAVNGPGLMEMTRDLQGSEPMKQNPDDGGDLTGGAGS